MSQEEIIKKISEAVSVGDVNGYNTIIEELKNGATTVRTDVEKIEAQLDPLKHDVCDRAKRPDKRVKIDPEDPDYQPNENVVNIMDGTKAPGYRLELVARVSVALQKLILKRAVSFAFGNPVKLEAAPEDKEQEAVLKAVKRVLYDTKNKSFNRRIARHLFASTEVAEVWYPVQNENKNTYGFESAYKLRCAIFSPLLGHTLHPYFDESGDMVAFSRGFSSEVDGKKAHFFETYTSSFHYMWRQDESGYQMVEGFPRPIIIEKIPVVYAREKQVEWDDVQNIIDRLEKLLSNFADTNDYHSAPKIFVKGTIIGFSKKGESGAIIEGDENSSAEYLSWQNAPEAVKLEIETLLKLVYTITQTPDISFDSMKGIGPISGIALKLLFMDAHLKVEDHREVLDEYLQRRINIIKAYVGKFKTDLAKATSDLVIEPVIVPYMLVNEADEIKIWQDANGGNPLISQRASFQKAGLTSDPDADYEAYKKEESSKMSFDVFEPTPA